MELKMTTLEEGQAETRDPTIYVCPTCGITVKLHKSE
jgi:rubrerythrin